MNNLLLISYIKKFKYFAIALLVALMLGVAPSFFSFDGQKTGIQNAVKEFTGYELVVHGDVAIHLLPLPKIILYNNKASNNTGSSFDVNKIVLGVNVGSLIKFVYTGDSEDLQITKLSIQDAEFSLAKIRDNFAENDNKKDFKLSGVELTNVSVVLDEDGATPIRIGNIYAKFQYGGIAFNDLKVAANFNIGGDRFYIDAQFSSINDKGDSDDVAIKFYGAGLDLKFDGKLADLFDNPLVDGNLNFATKLSPDEEINNKFLKRLANDGIQASGDLILNESQISLTNFKLASTSVTNMTAEFGLSYQPENEVNLAFNAEQINLDSFLDLVSKEQTVEQVKVQLTVLDYLELLIKPVLANFNFTNLPSLYGGISGGIGKVILNNREIQDIEFSSDVLEGDYFINNFKMNTPGNAEFRFKGKISHNDIRPELSGQLVYKVDDFNDFASWIDYQVADTQKNTKLYLSGDLNLIPRNLKMNNIKFATGDSMLTGKLHLKDKGTKYIDAAVSFRVNMLDLNTLGLPQKVDDIVTYMYIYDADKAGFSFSKYMNDYRALRTFPMDLSVDLLTDKMVYKDVVFEKLHTSFRISANDFNIDRIGITHELLDIDGVFAMQLTAFKPDIKLQLDAKKIDSKIYAKLFPSIDAMKKVYTDVLVKDTEATTQDPKEIAEQTTVYDVFNFFSANSFNGNFDINVNEFVIDENKFNKIQFKGVLNEGVLKFDRLAIGAFNGLFEAVGNMVIVTQVPALSISYAFNNFNPKQFLTYYLGYKNLDGYMSASGVANTVGVNMRSMLAQLRSDISVVGKKITIEGMDLGEIIKATESIGSLNEKTERIKYFSTNGATVLDDITGKIKVAGGVADLNTFVLGNNRMRGSYVGKVDYINGLFNSNARLAFIPTGLSNTLTLDLASSGNLKAPTFQPNTSSIIQFLRSKIGSEEQLKQLEEQNRSLLRNRRL